MDTTMLLLERELLLKKLEYAKQKLFDVSADLTFGNETKSKIADEISKSLDILDDKNHVW